MPGYHVDVIDLGLHLEEALAVDLGVETFTRKQALPAGLLLTETERDYFEGRRVGEKSWLCRRIELNALTAPALVAYIEQKLWRAGVRGKVTPPDDVLPRLARERYRQQMDAWVDRTMSALVSLDAIKASLAEAFESRFPLAEAWDWIEQAFAGDATLSWRAALDVKLRALLWEVSEEVETALRGKVIDVLGPQR
jgi:hypothetical protein